MNAIVFGGTGFLGRNIAKRLLNKTNHKVIIASRNPLLFENSNNENFIHEYCDITNDDNIMSLFSKYKPSYCVNSISLWKETSTISFEAVHKYPVKRIVNECNKYGTSLAYISGLGLDPDINAQHNFKSKFLKIRNESERIIIENQQNNRKSIIFRPGGIIDDAYPLNGMLTTLIPLLYGTPRYLPIPLFGNGQNKMSLISVNDLTKIVVDQLLTQDKDDNNKCKIIELGNPQNELRYVDLINFIHKSIYGEIGGYLSERLTVNVPLFVWWNLAKLVESSGNLLNGIVPLERAQVELMGKDLVATPNVELKDFKYEDCFNLIQNAIKRYDKHH